MKTLVLGGVRSGKSRYAGELARELPHPVTVIATGMVIPRASLVRSLN